MRKDDGLILDISSSCIAGTAQYVLACGSTDLGELSVGDASQFAFPCEPLVVYMFNPFLADVVARVVTSLERRPTIGRVRSPVASRARARCRAALEDAVRPSPRG